MVKTLCKIRRHAKGLSFIIGGGVLSFISLSAFATGTIKQAANLADVAGNINVASSAWVPTVVTIIGLLGVCGILFGIGALIMKAKKPDIPNKAIWIPIMAGVLALSVFILINVVSGTLFGQKSNLNTSTVIQGSDVFNGGGGNP